MSKVFEENAQKAISLSEGLKNHYSPEQWIRFGIQDKR